MGSQNPTRGLLANTELVSANQTSSDNAPTWHPLLLCADHCPVTAFSGRFGNRRTAGGIRGNYRQL